MIFILINILCFFLNALIKMTVVMIIIVENNKLRVNVIIMVNKKRIKYLLAFGTLIVVYIANKDTHSGTIGGNPMILLSIDTPL